MQRQAHNKGGGLFPAKSPRSRRPYFPRNVAWQFTTAKTKRFVFPYATAKTKDTGGSIWAVITRRLAGARMHACPSVLVSLKEAPPRFPPHWPFESLVLPRLLAPFGGCLLNLHQISRSVSGFSPATFFCRVSATHHGRFQFFCDSAVQSWVLFSSS